MQSPANHSKKSNDEEINDEKEKIEIIPMSVLKKIILEKYGKNGQYLPKPDPKILIGDIIAFKSSKSKYSRNVVLKCKYCDKTDHLSTNCSNMYDRVSDICTRCLSPEHEFWECPVIKCLRCNKIGHIAPSCPANDNTEKCIRCKALGHLPEDCLSKPHPLKKELFLESLCYFCKRPGHYICNTQNSHIFIKEYDDNDVSLSESNDSDRTEVGRNKITIKKKRHSKEVSEDDDGWKEASYNLENEKIGVYCPKCCKDHSIKDCEVDLCNNKTDIYRKGLQSKFFKMTNCGKSKLALDKNFIDDSFSDLEDYEDSKAVKNKTNNNNYNINIDQKGDGKVTINIYPPSW